MAASPCFEVDPRRRHLDAEVLRCDPGAGRPFAVLSDTILYPEGGGQPADRGFLGEVAVLDVQKIDGEIRHFLAAPVAPGPVEVRLDWERRFDHMQQHTGQHLLTALAEDRCGWRTTSFHLGPELCDIELDTARAGEADLARLGEAVSGEIRAAREVRVRSVAPGQFDPASVRTRGLPGGHVGDVRVVEIEGLDRNTCGGTHLRSTAEIELIHLVGTDPLRGGTRLRFVCGGRARRRLAALEAASGELRGLFGVPAEQLAGAARGRLAELKAAHRREGGLLDELADLAAAGLAARPEALVEAHFAARDMAFLHSVGKRLAALRPERAALLSAGEEPEAVFVLLGGEGALDLASAGPELCQILEGKGGGDRRMYQGKARSLRHRDEALARLRARLAPPAGL